MFLRRDVAQHRRTEPADHARAHGGSDVVVTRSDVGNQWPKRIERCFMTLFQLDVHVFLDHVHRNVTRAFDQYLNAVFPCDFGQLSQYFQFT